MDFARVLEVSRIALDKKKLTEPHQFELKLGIVRRLKAGGYSDLKIRQIMNFLRQYIRFKNKEIIRKLITRTAW